MPEELRGENYDAAFAAVRDVFNATLGSRRAVAPEEQLDVAAQHPVGANTLLDFQLAVQAHAFLGMGTDGHWLSVSTDEMAQARKRAGRAVIVTC